MGYRNRSEHPHRRDGGQRKRDTERWLPHGIRHGQIIRQEDVGMTVIDEFYAAYLHYSVGLRLWIDTCKGTLEKKQALTDE